MSGSFLKGAAVGFVCAVLGGAAVALAGSGIGGVFNLGVTNTVDAQTQLKGNSSTPQLLVNNQQATDGAIGVQGLHSAASGAGAGVRGETASTDANAVGVFGRVSAAGSASSSVAVRGVNAGPGTGAWGQSSGGYGVRGDGKFGLVGFGSDSGVWATSANSSGSGVYGQNTTSGNGVFGKSTSGYGVRGDGKFGVVGNGSDSGVWASTTNANGSGVYGQNTTSGRGVYGKSTSGNGVYGESSSQAGIYGSSQSFDGIYGTSNSTNNAGVSGHGGRFGLWGLGKTGVYGESNSGWFAFEAAGDAKQTRTGGGWVKAMAFIDPTKPEGQQVRQCFNSQVDPGTPNCGISAYSPALGTWDIDFGFYISDRFVIVQAADPLVTSACVPCTDLPGSEVSTEFRYPETNDPTNTKFWIFVL